VSELSKTTPAEPEWVAFVAIDWANRKHFWRLLPAGSQRYEEGELDNTPEAIEVWATNLQRRFGGRPIAVCLEQSRGPLVYTLTKYPHLVLFPVHPTTAARYRETFSPSGAKSDPHDAASLLDLLVRHRESLRPLQPDTEETRLLHFLVEERRQLVDEKTRHSNRLTAALKLYFPQILDWFDDLNSSLVADLLQRWPTLEELQHAHRGTLRKFFHAHNCRSEERIQERIEGIYQATPATKDASVVEAAVMSTRAAMALMATLRSHIAGFELRIAELVAAHPDRIVFASLPGAGEVLVPRLIVAFGTHRDRYQSAYEMQCYSGIAPVTEASGNSEWVHFRYACPKFLRQTFHEFAAISMRYSTWAKAYYDHMRNDQNAEHHVAVRSLAFKWIRIIYRCWKDGKPYDEEAYMETLRRRRSPLVGALALATSTEWKTIAGFQKLS